MTGDDGAELYVNGAPALTKEESRGWGSVAAKDVTGLLRDGDNVLAAACVNDGGPGALILKLSLTTQTEQ